MPPKTNVWLTVSEAALILRCTSNQVIRMMKAGKLVGLQTYSHADLTRSQGRYKAMDGWRIMHPGDQFIQYVIECDKHIEHVPLFTYKEAAAILGITVNSLHSDRAAGQIKRYKNGNHCYYTLHDLRQYLAQKRTQGGPTPRPLKYPQKRAMGKAYYFERLVEWAKEMLAEKNPSLGALIDEILVLPEPERSLRLEQLFSVAESLKALVAIPSVPGLDLEQYRK